ncbi:MAG: GNAT family N-acetyltransferase [Myxococcota bacterium]
MPFTPFDTARLTIRPLADHDLEAFVGYRSDPEVVRYTGIRDFDLDRGRAMIAEMRDRDPGTPGTWYQFALVRRDTGVLIGDCGLRTESAPHAGQTMEIGFTLATAHHRQGFGREAVLGVLGFAFGPLGAHRVFGNCDARNTASAALMASVGMRREAHHVEDWLLHGEWTSSLIFALLAREWREAHPTPG